MAGPSKTGKGWLCDHGRPSRQVGYPGERPEPLTSRTGVPEECTQLAQELGNTDPKRAAIL